MCLIFIFTHVWALPPLVNSISNLKNFFKCELFIVILSIVTSCTRGKRGPKDPKFLRFTKRNFFIIHKNSPAYQFTRKVIYSLLFGSFFFTIVGGIFLKIPSYQVLYVNFVLWQLSVSVFSCNLLFLICSFVLLSRSSLICIAKSKENYIYIYIYIFFFQKKTIYI